MPISHSTLMWPLHWEHNGQCCPGGSFLSVCALIVMYFPAGPLVRFPPVTIGGSIHLSPCARLAHHYSTWRWISGSSSPWLDRTQRRVYTLLFCCQLPPFLLTFLSSSTVMVTLEVEMRKGKGAITWSLRWVESAPNLFRDRGDNVNLQRPLVGWFLSHHFMKLEPTHLWWFSVACLALITIITESTFQPSLAQLAPVINLSSKGSRAMDALLSYRVSMG